MDVDDIGNATLWMLDAGCWKHVAGNDWSLRECEGQATALFDPPMPTRQAALGWSMPSATTRNTIGGARGGPGWLVFLITASGNIDFDAH